MMMSCLGREVWPDDFITHASGQKVYLSWPVPDCSDSCPWSWVADGSCDVSCNISDCSFDGGDCDLSNEDELGLYDENRHLVNYDDDINSYNENPHNHPHDSLNDNLFHDMNFGGDIALEDLSEPGKRMNSLLDILIRKKDNNDKFKRNLMNFTYFITSNYNGTVFDSDHTTPFTYNSTKKTFKVLNNSEINNAVKSSSHLKKSYFKFSRNKTQAIIKNGEKSLKKLSDLRMNNTYKNKPLNEKEEKNSKSTIIDSSTQSFVQELFGINNNSFNEYHVDGWNDTENHVELYPEHAQEDVSFKRGVQFKGNQSRSETLLNPLQNEASIQTINQTGSFLQNHNASTDIHIKNSETYNKQSVKHKTVRNVPYNSKLRKLYEKLNGKFEEPDKLLGKHGPSSPGKNTNLEKQQNSDYDEGWNPMTRKSAEKFSKIGTLKKKQKAVRVYDVHHYGNLPSSGKKPHDTFAESLLYVNRLFNQEFGFEPRKVPAHMPHLIDNYIMEQLQSRFSEQWKLTSSHKVRNANDMQFAFSYFYFLMSSRKTVPLEEIFDMFDTDHSGTWSDREIRTLLTRSYELPLSYSRVVKFENDIINCSNSLPEELSNIHISTPSYERYQDSKLPVVSKILITHCKPVADMLKKKFGKKKKYRYQIEHDKHLDVSFKMLNSNISQLVSHLDDIRRDPKKFICLNDNLDPDREEDNAIARAILQDMYESLFPQPSSFELPPEFRNRFLHIAELQAWRASRNTIRTIVYICLTILITFTLVNFFHVECRWLQRKIFHRSGQHYQLDSASVPCV